MVVKNCRQSCIFGREGVEGGVLGGWRFRNYIDKLIEDEEITIIIWIYDDRFGGFHPGDQGIDGGG
jgi:hypothetical protein